MCLDDSILSVNCSGDRGNSNSCNDISDVLLLKKTNAIPLSLNRSNPLIRFQWVNHSSLQSEVWVRNTENKVVREPTSVKGEVLGKYRTDVT